MEYDQVQLVKDFISEEKVKRLVEDEEKDEREIARALEEINLLYVAITRAKATLLIPESLVPEGFEPAKSVIVLKHEKSDESPDYDFERPDHRKTQDRITLSDIMDDLSAFGQPREKSYTVEQVRKKHGAAYKSWTKLEDQELTQLVDRGLTLKDLARHFGRSKGAIASRVKKLKLKKY
jgi:ATP-dependent exoDNAse (exonuclease V) beta subunit